MKHKTNVGPGLIVALGSPSDSTRNMGMGGDSDGGKAGASRPRPGDPNALSEASSGVSDTGGRATDDMDTVPLDMLSMPDDQEQMQPPEVGDVVNYQVTGKVVAIEGNDATVQRQSINGQELPGQEDETNPNESGQDANDDEDLRNQAAGIGMLS